jgi:hypothetical protein
MAGYQPLYIKAMETGLVQSREEFILPNDAYPTLENAYVWRERIKRKKGYQLLGRLARVFTNVYLGNSPMSSTYSFNLLVISGYVLTANNANPGKITTRYPHGLMTGDMVSISGVAGATGYNNTPFTITVVDPLNFTVGQDATDFGVYTSGGFFLSNRSIFANEPNATLVLASTVITDGTDTFTDQGNGTLRRQDGNVTSTINYITGAVTLNRTISTAIPFTVTFSYNPNLPVMGVRLKENQSSLNDTTVFFDTVYAYNYNTATASFQEFLPGTTWTGQNYEFFWTTNYWIGDGNFKIFWATNYSFSGDPIRYTNGQPTTNWIDFAPQIDNAITPNKLLQCLALIPFRGRLVAFNTSEGTSIPGIRYTNRIRWAAIGTPFTTPSAIVTSGINPNAWRDDIRGKGGFLDIPTSEDIVSVGFVRDNLVIYCDRSTWQLRYTGRTIAPFQIEKVNSELGSTSTFSAVQFDTSLIGIGDKGIIECDSFKSERIDIKIPDFVFHLQDDNNGRSRIQGIRDFQLRLAYWTYCSEQSSGAFPDKRLVYNYENDSWAIFDDSLTALGTFQEPTARNWVNTHIPWIQCNFPWIDQPSTVPVIVAGNQQGFIEQLDEQTTNDPSLYISSITSHTTTPTVITSPNHNLQTGAIIMITNIPMGTPFASTLNGNVFYVDFVDVNSFKLLVYDPSTQEFSAPQLDTATGYVGGGLIRVRDNFNIVSKKFNFTDDGQNIQLGYIDILMDSTEPTNPGAIAFNVYVDYNDYSATNTLPENVIADGTTSTVPDGFFNQIISTATSNLNAKGGSKFWQRVFCPTRGNFITIQYTFNNAQMAGIEQQLDVQIDAQILWTRRAGRMTQF